MYGTLVNGEESAEISVSDRGLQYGDGLFETLAVRRGRPLLWTRHLQRLHAGCRRMSMTAAPAVRLEEEALRLCRGLERGVLKIIVTRGGGGRGYTPPRPAGEGTRVLSTHPWPNYPQRFYTEGVAVRVCHTRLATHHPLAGLKHLNRAEQVMARCEWDDPEIPEGLMLDYDGHVIEGTMSNLFMVYGNELVTPDVSGAGVAGVMRGVILDAAEDIGMNPTVRPVAMAELGAAREVFLCSSLMGLWPVRAIDRAYCFQPGPVTRRLAARVAEYIG